MQDWIEKFKEHFPFLTFGRYVDEDYIGIVQHADNQFLNMYVYNLIQNEEKRKRFLELGDIWWWESNRSLPINIFLKEQFIMFKPYLKGFSRKDFDVVHGPITSLNDQINKRVKRKSIELILKV